MDKVCPICISGANNFVGRCIGSDCAWYLNFADDCSIPIIAGVIADRYNNNDDRWLFDDRPCPDYNRDE